MTAEKVELLHRAAARVREMAAAATDGTWVQDETGWGVVNDEQRIAAVGRQVNGAHIALWSPARALLVADWLEGEAIALANMTDLSELISELIQVTTQHTSGNEVRIETGRAETGVWQMHARTDSFALALARSILEKDPT